MDFDQSLDKFVFTIIGLHRFNVDSGMNFEQRSQQHVSDFCAQAVNHISVAHTTYYCKPALFNNFRPDCTEKFLVMLIRNILKLFSFIFPSGQGLGLPFIASYCGNNSGTDMLSQYGDYGTK
jgi:hypothetical protein